MYLVERERKKTSGQNKERGACGWKVTAVNPTKKGGTDNKVTLSTFIIHFTPS